MSEYHTPVLLEESVSALVCNADGIYADATFGGGGHSAEILSRLSGKGRLIAFDRDEDAIRNLTGGESGNEKRRILREALECGKLKLVHNNFRFIHNYAMLEQHLADTADGRGNSPADAEDGGGNSPEDAENGGRKGTEGNRDGRIFDGIIADLGVSSHQFDTPERGFSFRYDAPLDMRMSREAKMTAADIVNGYAEEDLAGILFLWGEVENSRKIASLICRSRQTSPIRTTGELCKAVEQAIPAAASHKALARIYQALRIEVNQEMRSLEKFLEGASRSLKTGGRLVVITYHSLEDRMVKNFIKTGNVEGKAQRDIYGNTGNTLRAVNRKVIIPEEDEIAGNTRARSAKMRVAEKI